MLTAAVVLLRRVTVASGVPTLWLGLLAYLESLTDPAMPTLRLLCVGGAAMRQRLLDFFEDRCAYCILCEGECVWWCLGEKLPLDMLLKCHVQPDTAHMLRYACSVCHYPFLTSLRTGVSAANVGVG
jgi:hypothetical protein